MRDVSKAMDRKTTVTTRARKLLQRIRDSEDQELVYAKGGGWVVDVDSVAGRDAWELLRFVLLRESYSARDGSYSVYEINPEGERLLADPNYVPEIVAKMAQEIARGDASSTAS